MGGGGEGKEGVASGGGTAAKQSALLSPRVHREGGFRVRERAPKRQVRGSLSPARPGRAAVPKAPARRPPGRSAARRPPGRA